MNAYIRLRYSQNILKGCNINIPMAETTTTAKLTPTIHRKDIDNGFAWLVLIASYSGLVLHCMTLYMNGVIYVALLQTFGEGPTKTSFVVTLLSTLLCLGCPVSGIIINRFSTRVAITIGGALLTLGYALSAFVPNINSAIISLGVLAGIGHGFVVTGCICAVGFYFDRYRYMVLSFCYVLMGLGLFVATPVSLLMLDKLGLSSLFLTCASITAQICLIGVLCKPSIIESGFQLNRKVQNKSRSKKVSSSLSGGFSLLKYNYFLCYLCTNVAWGFSLVACTTHLPNYIFVTGGSDTDIERVMMVYSISNILGRIAAFLLLKCSGIDSLYGYILSFGLSAIFTMLFPLYSKLKVGIYVFAIQSAFFVGIPNVMMTQLPERFIGIARLSEANGLSFFFFGIGYGPGPFIIGFVYDKTRSYEYSFVLAGIVLLIGAILGYVALRFERNKPWSTEVGITIDVKEESNVILKDGVEKS